MDGARSTFGRDQNSYEIWPEDLKQKYRFEDQDVDGKYIKMGV